MKKHFLLVLITLLSINLFAQTVNSIEKTDKWGHLVILDNWYDIETVTVNNTITTFYINIVEDVKTKYDDLILQIRALNEMISLTTEEVKTNHDVKYTLHPHYSGGLIVEYKKESGWDAPNIEYLIGVPCKIITDEKSGFLFYDYLIDSQWIRYRLYETPKKLYDKHDLAKTRDNLLLVKKTIEDFIKEKNIDVKLVDL